jgi:hypothetical protein
MQQVRRRHIALHTLRSVEDNKARLFDDAIIATPDKQIEISSNHQARSKIERPALEMNMVRTRNLDQGKGEDSGPCIGVPWDNTRRSISVS